MADIVGKRIDPLDHFTKPEWQDLLRRAAVASKVRNLPSYTHAEFLSLLKAAESGK